MDISTSLNNGGGTVRNFEISGSSFEWNAQLQLMRNLCKKICWIFAISGFATNKKCTRFVSRPLFPWESSQRHPRTSWQLGRNTHSTDPDFLAVLGTFVVININFINWSQWILSLIQHETLTKWPPQHIALYEPNSCLEFCDNASQ